jgi:hypothetical protein
MTGVRDYTVESHLSGRADTISARHNPEQTMRVLGGLAPDRATNKCRPAPTRNRLVGRGRRWAIKTSPRTARGH